MCLNAIKTFVIGLLYPIACICGCREEGIAGGSPAALFQSIGTKGSCLISIALYAVLIPAVYFSYQYISSLSHQDGFISTTPMPILNATTSIFNAT